MTLASINNGWRLAAGLCLLLGACTFDGKDLDSYPCNAAHPQCPAGYTCNGSRCVKPGDNDNGVPDGPVTKSDTTTDGLVPDSPWPDAPLADGPKPDGPKPDGPVVDGPVADSPATDGPLQPDGPLPDGPLPPDAWVQLDIPQPDMLIPDLPPPDLVPPADGACSPNGATQSCYTGPAGTKGVGICTTGTQTCTSSSWGNCDGEVTPAASDPCDGLDNDCDGTKDEGYACVKGTGQGCTTICGSWGYQTCSATCAWNTCAVPVETCNGKDDDCDTKIDEDFDCVQGTTGASCPTICGSTGKRDCGTDCKWKSCVPPTESCNGKDDDCDLKIDEDFDCVQGTTGASCPTICGSTGKRDCGSDCKWKSCVPPAESCNGKDDDCDLKIDEDFACVQNSTLSCTTTCGSTGTRICSSTCKVPVFCTPPAEVCNFLDDDCVDGIDNGLPPKSYWKDSDGDGQGNYALKAEQYCKQPAGYAPNNDDCYDGNKDAKKGQTAWFTTHRGDNSFDYNCDGKEEKWSTETNTLCVWNITSCMGLANVWKSTPPACGLWGYLLKCVELTPGSKTCVNQQGAWTQQKCR